MNAIDRIKAEIASLRSEYIVFEIWVAPLEPIYGEPEFLGYAKAFTFAEACAYLLGNRIGFDFEQCTYYGRNLWSSKERARIYA